MPLQYRPFLSTFGRLQVCFTGRSYQGSPSLPPKLIKTHRYPKMEYLFSLVTKGHLRFTRVSTRASQIYARHRAVIISSKWQQPGCARISTVTGRTTKMLEEATVAAKAGAGAGAVAVTAAATSTSSSSSSSSSNRVMVVLLVL